MIRPRAPKRSALEPLERDLPGDGTLVVRVQEAKDAGVLVFAGGFDHEDEDGSMRW